QIESAIWRSIGKQSTVMGLFFVLGLVVAYGLVRRTQQPLRQIVARLKDIAEGEGDLTRRLTVESHDEIGETAHWFNVFVEKMHSILAEVKKSVVQTHGASMQLSTAAQQLSTGTQEQAASLEETAASLEQITGTVKQTADNAQQANQLAGGSRGAA